MVARDGAGRHTVSSSVWLGCLPAETACTFKGAVIEWRSLLAPDHCHTSLLVNTSYRFASRTALHASQVWAHVLFASRHQRVPDFLCLAPLPRASRVPPRYVDEVIIGSPCVMTDDLIKTFNIGVVVRGSVSETSMMGPVEEVRGGKCSLVFSLSWWKIKLPRPAGRAFPEFHQRGVRHVLRSARDSIKSGNNLAAALPVLFRGSCDRSSSASLSHPPPQPNPIPPQELSAVPPVAACPVTPHTAQ